MGRSRVTSPTRDQKVIMSAAGLVVNNWRVLRETPGGVVTGESWDGSLQNNYKEREEMSR